MLTQQSMRKADERVFIRAYVQRYVITVGYSSCAVRHRAKRLARAAWNRFSQNLDYDAERKQAAKVERMRRV